MVVANCLHATLNLSLPIQLRSRHPLVELALFHQDLSRRRLTYFLYLHRVLNHHRANARTFKSVLSQNITGQPMLPGACFLSLFQMRITLYFFGLNNSLKLEDLAFRIIELS